jgi:hypothetical protein
VDDEKRALAGQLARVIADEKDAQVGMHRDLDRMPALVADALLDYFDVQLKPGATTPARETSLRHFEIHPRDGAQ